MLIGSVLDKYRNLPVGIKATVWFFVCSFLQKAIAAISTPIFTRLMSPAEFGQFYVFLSWLEIVGVVVTLNLFCGVYMQGLVKFGEKRYRFTSTMQGMTLTLVITWLLMYLIFSDFWDKLFGLTTFKILLMFVIIWTNAVFGFWSSEKRFLVDYRNLVKVTLSVSLLQPILGVLLVLYCDDKVTARILGVAILNFLFYVPLFILQIKRDFVLFSSDIWKYAANFNLPLVPHYLSMVLLGNINRIMINDTIGAAESGIYSLGFAVSHIMIMFNSAMLQTFEPWLYKHIRDKKFAEMAKFSYPAFIFIAVINLFLVAFAPEIINIFAPRSYADAVWVIPPLAASMYFMFLYSFFAVFEFYYEKTKFIMFATFAGAALNIVLNHFLLEKFGFCVAGYATLLCYMVFAILHFVFMKLICKTYLENVKVYNGYWILAIGLILLVGCGIYAVLYNTVLLRYGITAVLLCGIVCLHNKIYGFIKNLVIMRKAV